MSLKALLDDRSSPIKLYGTTPPRATAAPEKVERSIDLLAKRLDGTCADGVIVYDVQDETARNSDDRPFDYEAGMDSLSYANRVFDRTGLQTICYKCVVRDSSDRFVSWLEGANAARGVGGISLVGGASSNMDYPGVSLEQAVSLSSEYAHYPIGGVTIPERHAKKDDEPERIRSKMDQGMRYFVSQAVYDAELACKFTEDFVERFENASMPFPRFVFTFAPCGREKTLKFMKWLGIQIPDTVGQRILGSENPLEESIKVCEESLKRILDTVNGAKIPVGINVESVSVNKAERDASIEMLERLGGLL